MKNFTLYSRIWTAALLVLAACSTPGDSLFIPGDRPPIEVRDGILQVTFNPGPDVVRAISPGSEAIIYRSLGQPGFEDTWRILKVPVSTGAATEEGGLYRRVLLNPAGSFAYGNGYRLYVVWRSVVPRLVGACDAACRKPPLFGLEILRLEATDGAPLFELPTAERRLPISTGSAPNFTVTFSPSVLDVEALGTDPYGPVVILGTDDAIYSDGDNLFRINTLDSTLVQFLGPGAFPSIAPDGRRLLASVPAGPLDVTETSCIDPGTLGACTQTTRVIKAAGWLTVMYDIETSTVDTLTSGLEAEFHPSGTRILVRRPEGLVWVDLMTGEEIMIPLTEGAYSPAIAPDGSFMAFSANWAGNANVYVLRTSP